MLPAAGQVWPPMIRSSRWRHERDLQPSLLLQGLRGA